MKGFTLIEVMITVVITGVLVAMAAPSFSHMLMRNEVSSLSMDFVGSLRLAQSEAIRRGVRVSVSPHQTSSTQWKNGWDIHEDTTVIGKINGSEELIRTFVPSNEKATLTASSNVFQDYVTFLPNGTVSGKGGFSGNFRLCPSNKDKKYALTLEIERSGNVNSNKTATSCP